MGRTKSQKSALATKSKLKKDPGVPKLPRLKEKYQNSGEKQALPNPSHNGDPEQTMNSEPTTSALASLAAIVSPPENELEDSSLLSVQMGRTKEQMRRYYLRALHKVIDESDIIVLVLDARDPEGCRSRLVEEEVRRREAEGKRLVFVLNKIDLIPRSNAEAWLKYLRHSTPTLPFRSSTQHQRTNLSSSTTPALLKLLKAYRSKSGTATVGVVGYPNVGKSSLINTLKRSKVCAVAAQPGHTKELQSVQLERGLKIVDSPGVVFDNDDSSFGKVQTKGNVLLRNVVKVEDVQDPIAVVEEILQRTDPVTIQKIYSLPEYTSTLEFLTMLAMTSGKLLKGGTPDINSTARQVLLDWNHQKIPFFSVPPTIHPSFIPSTVPGTSWDSSDIIAPGAENVGKAQIVTTFSEPFELDGLFTAADAGAFHPGDVPMVDEEGDIFCDAVNADKMDEDVQWAKIDPMKVDIDTTPSGVRKRPRSPSPTPAPQVSSSLAEGPTHTQRQPKRQRRSKEKPAYDTPPDPHVLSRMEKSNPLSRKILKKEAKRARKLRRAKSGSNQQSGGVMEVDDVDLQFTFMA